MVWSHRQGPGHACGYPTRAAAFQAAPAGYLYGDLDMEAQGGSGGSSSSSSSAAAARLPGEVGRIGVNRRKANLLFKRSQPPPGRKRRAPAINMSKSKR